MSSAYVIDTSSLIGLDLACPIRERQGVWGGIEALASQGRIVAPYSVYKEIDPRNADLHLWAKNHMEVFIAHDREMIEPAQKVAAGNRSLLSRDRSRPNAGPYATAPAKLRQSRLAGRR